MEGALKQVKLRHLEQLAHLLLPPSTEYESPPSEVSLATKEQVKGWIRESASQIAAAINACRQGLSPNYVDWNVARLALLESVIMYYRKDKVVLEAREAYIANDHVLALRLYDVAQEDIVELASMMGLGWLQLCDLVQYHPDQSPFWAGPFSGAFYDPNEHSHFVAIAFKGTSTVRELIVDLKSTTTIQATNGYLWGKTVNKGFYYALFDTYSSQANWRPIQMIKIQLRDILQYLARVIVPVYVTGHSLGAAYATYTHAELIRTPIEKAALIDLHTFGSPRTGLDLAAELRNMLVQMGTHSWRIVNGRGDFQDIVTTVPPAFPSKTGFIHIDIGIQIDKYSSASTMASEVDVPGPIITYPLWGSLRVR